MESRYSINTFVKTTNIKRPKELACYSIDSEAKLTISPENYPHYYFQDGDLADGKGYDLKAGFTKTEEREFNPARMDYLLSTIANHERSTGKKIDTKVITWRGLIRKLMLLPFDNMDKIVLNIQPFDGQLFIQSDVDHEYQQYLKEKDNNNETYKMAIYSGYKFENLTTLDKPWGQSKRSEIESRNKKPIDPVSQYATVVKTTIGSTKLVIGAEVDAVWDYKPHDNADPLSHYVELKCTKAIDSPKSVFNFENKLLRAWAQCFLIGIPKIIYGFRDEQFILRAIEEFQTEQIPVQLKNNPINLERQKQDPNFKVKNKPILSIKFICGLLEWIENSVPVSDESKVYSLVFDPAVDNMYLTLNELPKEKCDKINTEHLIVSNEFKAWRNELKDT